MPRTVAEHVERVLALVTPLPANEVTLAELVDGGGDGTVDGSGAVGRMSSGRSEVEKSVPQATDHTDNGPTARHPAGKAVLAEDVRAVWSVPTFDHSAMDGYAVRGSDLPVSGEPVTLQVVADIPAAAAEPRELAPGTAARIMTGAPLPPGADAVVPVERTSTGRFDPGRTTDTVTLGRQPRDHIRRRGSDITTGSVLARAGDELTAPVVAGLAAAGVPRVRVRRRPRVAVVATGSELVPSGSPTRPGEITDSNSLMLAAAARAAGADVVRLGPVPDDPDALRATLDAAAGPRQGGYPARDAVASTGAVASADAGASPDSPHREDGPTSAASHGIDLIVTAGGVSAGAADVVRAVLTPDPQGQADDEPDHDPESEPESEPESGWSGTARGSSGRSAPSRDGTVSSAAVSDVDLAAVGMKPGRPQALARWRGVPWIAVPGTPVAAYVSFVMFVRPAIARLHGVPHPSAVPETRPAAAGWKSPRGREQVVPVRVLPHGVEPTGDGHHLSALIAADALAVVPADVEKVDPGDPVPVIPL